MNGAAVYFIKFRYTESDRVESVGTPRRVYSHFGAFKFWRLDLGLLIVVVFHADMKHKYHPNVTKILKPIQRTIIDFVVKRKSCTSVFNKTTLSGRAKLLPKTGLQKPNRSH